MKYVIIFLVFNLRFFFSAAQSSPGHMDFETYEPKSTLVVPQHLITHAKFPFFDVHNHQWDVPTQDISELFSEMDKLDMRGDVRILSGKDW